MKETFPQGVVKDELTNGCLVLESGAFRGIYQQGALDALLEEGIRMQCTVGVSVGALNGAAYSAGQIGQAIRFTIENLGHPRFVGATAMRENHGPIGFRYMFEQISDWDEQARGMFFDPSSRFVTVATNMRTGQPEYFERVQSKKMLKIVQASASMPYISRPIVINGDPYLDGGCSVRVPWRFAFENGYQKIIIIRNRPESFRYQISRTAMLAAQTRYLQYPAFSKSLAMIRMKYNRDAALLEQLKAKGRIFVIAPKTDRLSHLMQMDQDTLTKLYWSGYQDIKRQKNEIQTYLQCDNT